MKVHLKSYQLASIACLTLADNCEDPAGLLSQNASSYCN